MFPLAKIDAKFAGITGKQQGKVHTVSGDKILEIQYQIWQKDDSDQCSYFLTFLKYLAMLFCGE